MGKGKEQTMSKYADELVGRTITKAEVNGYGMELTFEDGRVFYFDASDGGYSSYGFGEEGADDDTI